MRTPRQHEHSRSGRSVSRTAGFVVLAGLATGGAFAIGTGISSAAGGTATTPAATATPSTTTPSTGTDRPDRGWGGPGVGHRMGGGGFGRGHGFGGRGGTITAVTATTLTLRTEQGTETVTTTPATSYARERVTVSRAQLNVGEVVRVDGTPSGSAMSAPGTGSVTATRVEVVLPVLAGRVASISGSTYTLIGPDGQLLTVTSTGSTRYYNAGSASTAAAVKVGTRVAAEGTQDSVTHLVADVIAVAPARASWMGGPDGPGAPPAAPAVGGSSAVSGADAAGGSDAGSALTDAATGASA